MGTGMRKWIAGGLATLGTAVYGIWRCTERSESTGDQEARLLETDPKSEPKATDPKRSEREVTPPERSEPKVAAPKRKPEVAAPKRKPEVAAPKRKPEVA